MKAILSSILITASLPAIAADPGFVRIQPDQSSYSVGSKAVIFAHIDRLPIEKTKELFITIGLSGETVNMIPLSEKIAVALPGRFHSPGVLPIESNIYLQDKAEQIQLAHAVALHQREIDSLLRELEKERDSEAKEILERRIGEKRTRISALQGQMEKARSLIEVRLTRLTVLPESKFKADSIFTLSADRDPAVYAPGESAVFTAHLNSLFEGPDGPKEHIFTGAVEEVLLDPPAVQGDDYIFASPLFTSIDVGEKTFSTSLFVRSEAQSSLLRSAHLVARKLRDTNEKELAEAIEPAHRAYLEWKVTELNRVIDAITVQLEEILLPVDSANFTFTVAE